MKKREILLRFDDICPSMNWDQWNRAKRMMDDANVTALLGVIPDCNDPELAIDEPNDGFWEYIKSLSKQGFTVAMHGYQHKFILKANGLVTRKKISEFAGLPYGVQLEMIRKGKAILDDHGIETDIFFAPAHSYDDNTLRALAACGFKYVSDGYSSKPYIRHGIKLLPCRSGGIPRIKNKRGHFTAIIHAHEWVRKDTGVDWKRFQDIMTYHVREIVPFNDFCHWKCGNSSIQRINEGLYLSFKRYLVPVLKKLIRKK